MTTTITNGTNAEIDVRACALTVMSALSDLQGYLSASVNPDRIALADLDMEPMGWTKRVYSPRAFEIWTKQHNLFAKDPPILHHLAIMHHARAFDLEAGPNPSHSDADWRDAMSYWHRLHGLDAFWEQLTQKACAGTARQDVIKKLRAEFPQMILAIHFDIALDKETREKRKSRAKFHVSMVHKSPFEAQIREEAQRAAYNRYIRSVRDEVWQSNELREEVLEEGQKAIIEYLDFDPGCLPALEDALRLQRRIQRSRNTAWQAMSADDPKRKALLLSEKKDAEAWRPFFDQLAAVADRLDEDVREDLARWYHGRGGDLCALDEREKAISFFENAVRLCRPDDEGRKRYVRELVQALAYLAREKAGNETLDAKSYCEKVRKRNDLSLIASFLLAQAYVQLSEFGIAEDICGRGLNIEPDFDDLEADEWLSRLAEFKREIPLLKLMPAAKKAMESGQFKAALQPLDDAEKLAKAAGTLAQHNSIYWLRAQAYLALDRIADAKRDVSLYHGLLDRDSPPSDIEAGRRLTAMVAAKEEMGNIQPLLEKARQAMQADRNNDALVSLNEAAQKAPQSDVIFFLRAQAFAAAGKIPEAKQDVKKVTDLAETDEDREHAQKLKEMISQAETAWSIRSLMEKAKKCMETELYKEALQALDEAAKKAPQADSVFFLRAQAHLALGKVAEARRDAKTVSSLAKTKDDVQAAAKLQAFINQQESVSGVKNLLTKAKSALENSRFSEAVKALDDAAKLAPNVAAIYFLRAQARAGAQDRFGVIQDVQKFEQLADSIEEKEAAQRLKRALL